MGREVSYREYTHMRIFCGDCGGAGTFCRVCKGTGFVCPKCKGARIVRIPQKGTAPMTIPCGLCTVSMSDGVHYDEDTESAAIVNYIEAWAREEVIDEVETHQRQAEESLKKAKYEHQQALSDRKARLARIGIR